MFTQQKLLFQFTKAIALVILLCFIFTYQAQGEKAVQKKAKDVAEITAQIDIEHYEKEFEKYIKKRLFVELKKAFKESKFDKMGELLGDNTILATPQGETLKGKDKLSKFWKKEKEGGITEVHYTLKYRYVSIVADPIVQPDPQDTIDAVGHAIIEYHLITLTEGGTLTNRCGSLDHSARHPRVCVWGY